MILYVDWDCQQIYTEKQIPDIKNNYKTALKQGISSEFEDYLSDYYSMVEVFKMDDDEKKKVFDEFVGKNFDSYFAEYFDKIEIEE